MRFGHLPGIGKNHDAVKMKTDVVLIRPPLTIERQDAKSLSFPLGLGYLSGVLEKEFSVKIIDCLAEGFRKEKSLGQRFFRYGLGPDKIKERLSKLEPEIVGITCPFSIQFSDALEVCKAIKEENPLIKTVLGGAHPSSMPGEVLKEKQIDFVILGEGEMSFLELCRRLLNNKSFREIDGLGYKENGEFRINPKTHYIESLDSLPFPARELFPMEVYFEVDSPHGILTRSRLSTNIVTSRGCPYDCIFCSVHTIWSHKYRVRSPENVILEMEQLKKRYSIQEFQFEDDNLTLNKERAKKIFKLMIEKELNIQWTAPNGIALWTLDEEMVKLMKESGCYKVALGIESGDEFILKKVIKKPLDLNIMPEKIGLLKKHGINSAAFFVVGFPQERKENLRNTFRLSSQLDVDNIHFYFATPYPGTRLRKLCQENNLLKNKSWRELKVSTLNIENRFLSEKEIKNMIRNSLLRFFTTKFLASPFKVIVFLIKRFRKEKRRFIFYISRFR